jgi:hypothetical protein
LREPLNAAAARDQIEDQDDDRDHQEDVNQVAAERDDEPAEKPKNQKNNEDGPEHNISFWLVSLASCAATQARLKIFRLARFFAMLRFLHEFEQSAGGLN